MRWGVAALGGGGLAEVEEAIRQPGKRPCVVLIADAAALAQPEHRDALDALSAAAQRCRDAGRPFFAVLVDPDAQLDLPRLYHEAGAR